MKKIGLVSVCNPNYGSMLQTYALHKYLKTNDVDNDIILYTKRNDWKQIIRVFNLPLLKMKMNVVIRDLKCKFLYKNIFEQLQLRSRKFNDFKNEQFSFSRNYIGWNDLLTVNKEYDTFIIGSDQVWNPINIGTDFYNLLFTADDKYRISYASSFGVSNIPVAQMKKTGKYLNRIQFLSTREVVGRKIIKELTGREAMVVCDPTLLIDRDYWLCLKGEKRFIEEKYIFCYFLGNNPSHRAFANRFKALVGYKLVALQHLDEFVKSDIMFADIKPFNVGPAEFINLIANAEYVLTDSFHGSIFSILFEKIFFTFSRFENLTTNSTNSRIDSLLNMAGIPERNIKSTEDLQKCLEMVIDYEMVHMRVNEFQKNSRDFLNEALTKRG